MYDELNLFPSRSVVGVLSANAARASRPNQDAMPSVKGRAGKNIALKSSIGAPLIV